ncbi:MAG: hypothetical protein KBF76_11310 [Verrucomicrobiales bacterium]|nr:hypothetical protein [Verrucomicrobiales bacterium]
MKQIPAETKDLILNLREKFPPEKREAFSRAIGSRLEGLASSHTASYALFGAVCGVVIDMVPLTGFISDDWVEIGAALGAWVGYSKDQKERDERMRIKRIVEDSIREALAGTATPG